MVLFWDLLTSADPFVVCFGVLFVVPAACLSGPPACRGHVTGSPSRSAAPSSSISSASRGPEPVGLGGPPGAGPSYVESAVRRQGHRTEPQLLAVVALDDLGEGADGGAAPRLEVGEQPAARRSRRRGSPGRRGTRARPRVSSVSDDRHSTASAPCPGAGSICSGSSTSVTSSSRPSRASPARARITASTSPSCTLRSRVSTLPRIATTSRPSPSACSWAARRGEPVPTLEPTGSSPRVRPSRATTASRGSSRSGHRGHHDADRIGCGQVLEGVHRDVDVAAQQGVAQRR